MPKEDRIKTLAAILTGINIDGLDIANSPLETLEMVGRAYKELSIAYNKTHLLPIGTNPSQRYIEERRIDVTQKMPEKLAEYKKNQKV